MTRLAAAPSVPLARARPWNSRREWIWLSLFALLLLVIGFSAAVLIHTRISVIDAGFSAMAADHLLGNALYAAVQLHTLAVQLDDPAAQAAMDQALAALSALSDPERPAALPDYPPGGPEVEALRALIPQVLEDVRQLRAAPGAATLLPQRIGRLEGDILVLVARSSEAVARYGTRLAETAFIPYLIRALLGTTLVLLMTYVALVLISRTRLRKANQALAGWAEDTAGVLAAMPGVLIRSRRGQDGIWRRSFVGAAVTEVTGHSVEEALRDDWWSANVDPAVAQRDWAVGTTPQMEPTTEREFAFRHKRGHWIWIRHRSRTYASADGQLEMISVWNDVTERRDLRLQRETLTADLQRVIATMPGVLVRLRRGEDGRWAPHFISPSIEALTGDTVEEAKRHGWWQERADPEDRERLRNMLCQSDPTLPTSTDFRFRHSQGHMIWVHCSTRGYVDASGQAELICVWSDITAEKRLLLDREELANDLQAVIQAIPGVLMRIREAEGGSWQRVYVAPGIEALTGHSVAEALRPEWLHENLDPAEPGLIDAQMGGPFPDLQHSVEFRFRHKQGHWIWIRRFTRGNRGPDGRREIIAIWNDVTHEKRLTEQLTQSAKLAQLGEVATGMAHELNQPLAGISLAAENALFSLDRLPDPPERAQQKLGLIVDLTKRASDIIDHMRIFGRNDSAARAAVPLPEVFAGAGKLMASRLRAAEVRLDVTLPAELPPVLGKSVPLEQVIMNLIGNACDAYAGLAEPVPLAQRAIRITAHAEADWVIIEVQDAAGGIPEDILPRIFEPFFTTKPVGQGTGLGLSISYGIISDMGGTITATNRDGGCLTRILLPVAR
jgi:PAS domain S-box-containing protein